MAVPFSWRKITKWIEDNKLLDFEEINEDYLSKA